MRVIFKYITVSTEISLLKSMVSQRNAESKGVSSSPTHELHSCLGTALNHDNIVLITVYVSKFDIKKRREWRTWLRILWKGYLL